jgi:hypothetical protein
MPPIDSGPRQRKGYQALSDDIPVDPDTPGTAESTALMDHPDPTENESGSRNNGWGPLIWSFAFSGALTVSSSIAQGKEIIHLDTGQISAYFFPVLFAIPLFGNYLAREWAWSFTPSLSYVGQGIYKPTGQKGGADSFLQALLWVSLLRSV